MATNVGNLFNALGDPRRLQVVELLSRSPRRAGELAEEAGLSAPAMSRHLRVLLEAGMIADERGPEDARLRVFRLRREGLTELEAWLERQKRQWDDQLASFQHHVEGRAER